MNWYVGQKVVSVESGNIFTITTIGPSRCKCAGHHIETKEMRYIEAAKCPDCNTYVGVVGKGRHSNLFRPLEDSFAKQALNKAIEQAEEILEIIETVIPVENSH